MAHSAQDCNFEGTCNFPAHRSPLLLKHRSSNFLILLVVCAAVFTDIFLYGLLVPVLPFALIERVGIPLDQMAKWNGILLALLNLGLCVGSPIFGFYADYAASRKLPFLIGLLALAGATLLLCLSKSIILFASGRFLQGVSAAICWAVGLSLLADSMKEKIGWAMGWVNSAMTAGFLLSPIVGGIAYAKAGYYAVYYMAFGLIACDIFLRLVLIEKKVARNWIVEDESCTTGSADTTPHESQALNPRGRIDESNEAGRTGLATKTGQGGVVGSYWTLIKSRRLLASLLGCIMQSASKLVSLFCPTLASHAHMTHIRLLHCRPTICCRNVSLGLTRGWPHLPLRFPPRLPVALCRHPSRPLRNKMALLRWLLHIHPAIRLPAICHKQYDLTKGSFWCIASAHRICLDAFQHAVDGRNYIRH